MKKNAVIAGAGPAGLSAAIGLMRLGFSVEVFEEKKEWSPRVCGSFLSPESRAHLQWLGVLAEVESESVPCSKASLHAGNKTSSIMLYKPSGPGMAVSRKILEAILLKKAQDEGVAISYGKKISEVPECDLFVAAGGRYFSMENGRLQTKGGWAAFNIQFRGTRQVPGELSLHFFPKSYVGTITFKDGTTNVSGLVHSDFMTAMKGGWEEALLWMKSRDKALNELLQSSQKLNPIKGIPHLPFGSHLTKNQSYYSVGDSAAVCDPYMGEGISRALSSGPMLYRSLAGNLSRQEWKEIGWKNYYNLWRENYDFRQKLGSAFRFFLKNKPGIFSIYGALAHSRIIRSWYLRQIHQPSLWTDAH